MDLYNNKMDFLRETKQIRWSPSPLDWVRLNTDETSKNDLIAEWGGDKVAQVSGLEASQDICVLVVHIKLNIGLH